MVPYISLKTCDFLCSCSIKVETNLGPVTSNETKSLILPTNACPQLPLQASLQAASSIATTSALQAVVAAAQEKQPVMVTAEQLEKQQTQWSRVDLLLETLQQQQIEIKVIFASHLPVPIGPNQSSW